MKIQEFARSYCSYLLRAVSSQAIYDRIREQDDFPYEDIRIGEDGLPTKVVYLDDNQERFIDIYELISYSREDVEATKDPDLLLVFENYMSQIDTEEVDIADTLRLAREWRELRDKEAASAGLLS